MNTEVRNSCDFHLDFVGGILLRDIAKFVKIANRFSSSVIVRCGRASADGKSLLQMSGLHLAGGNRLTVTAWGWDAPECMDALAKAVEDWSPNPVHAMAA